jgi:hypothetical protein
LPQKEALEMGRMKAVVIGMGVLILAGFVTVAVTLVMRAQGGSAPRQPFQNLVTLPAGAAVVETRMGDGQIVLRLQANDGSQLLVVLSATDGSVRGRINLAVQPQ